MSGIKDRLYYFLAVKNENVRREYDAYVQLNPEEHVNNPMKHWIILLRLNLHYRILHRTTPMFSLPAGKKSDFIYPESAQIKRENADELIKRFSEYDIISFDIFDTLIFRPLNAPTDLFEIMAEELCIPDFKEIRRNAEKVAREKSDKPLREIDIDDIYNEISLPDKDGIMAREISLEKTFCYANPYMYKVYNGLIKNGKKIIAVSDMYLKSETLKNILESCGYGGISEIFVSCELHNNKGKGGLQRLVQKRLGKKRYIHIGDNYASDYKASKSAGWDAYYYKNINEPGKKYRPDTSESLALSVYSGIISAGLYSGGASDRCYEHGFIYGGFQVYAFCTALYEFIKEKGTEKILFLSKSGDIICKAFNILYNDIDFLYLQLPENAETLSLDNTAEYIKQTAGKPSSVCIVSYKAEAEKIKCITHAMGEDTEIYTASVIDTDEKTDFSYVKAPENYGSPVYSTVFGSPVPNVIGYDSGRLITDEFNEEEYRIIREVHRGAADFIKRFGAISDKMTVPMKITPEMSQILLGHISDNEYYISSVFGDYKGGR